MPSRSVQASATATARVAGIPKKLLNLGGISVVVVPIVNDITYQFHFRQIFFIHRAMGYAPAASSEHHR